MIRRMSEWAKNRNAKDKNGFLAFRPHKEAELMKNQTLELTTAPLSSGSSIGLVKVEPCRGPKYGVSSERKSLIPNNRR